MAPISVRSSRRVACAVAALLLCTWISGCALWPFSGKGLRQAEKTTSTHSAAGTRDSSRGKDRHGSKETGPELKTAGDPDGESSRRSSGKQQRAVSASEGATSRSSRGKSSADGDSHSSGPAFQKHDHAKYVRTIKNKAIDRLNKSRAATHAILCRNPTTDQWSLTIYSKGQRSYSYVSYAWDDVDEDWEKIFSDKRVPLSRWRQHVRYSTQDKECSPLKGGNLR